MKHAYLIIAHNEFKILEKLVHLLDDSRNDIYLHIDRKVKLIPNIKCQHAGLYVLNEKERLDVRWGSISQIKVELQLFIIASKNHSYGYYHLISGVHLPIKNQDYIHKFYERCNQQEVLQFMSTNEEEITFKIKRLHLFVNNYLNPNKIIRKIDQLMWVTVLYFEKRLDLYRHCDKYYLKASQWASLTDKAVRFILKNKTDILKEYHHTFCSDEFYLATLLSRHPEMFSIKDSHELLKVQFHRGNPITYTAEAFMELVNSDCLFARKFSEKHMDVVNRISNHISSKTSIE